MGIHRKPWKGFLMAGLIAASLGCWSFSAYGAPAIDNGLQWLSSNQSVEGYWGKTFSGTPIRDTTAAANAFQMLAPTSPAYTTAIQWLATTDPVNQDYLSHRLGTYALAGLDISADVAVLKAGQLADGGWGLSPDHESDVLDTAFALEALTLAGVTDATVIAPAVGFLMFRQQASGGWADGENIPSVYLTAISLRALWYYRHVYVGVPAALSNGKTFLFSQRDGAGLWGDDPSAPLRAGFNTALALLAIIPTLPDLSSVTTSITALQAAQLANGSWDNDAYTTALDIDSSDRLTCLSSSAQRRRIEQREEGGSRPCIVL